MTVAIPGMDYSEYAGIGTEDVDASEFGITRWKIDHNEGLFVNDQNDLAYGSIDVVLLNLVKQRVYFPKEISDDNSSPLCKSNNNKDGFPGDEFPWEDYAHGYQEDIPLACASCNFSQWGKRNAAGKATPPLCKEIHTFAFVALNDEVNGTPGLISLKGTSIGPARKYVTPFAQRKWPLFIQSTRISLEPNMFKGRKFYVAKFDGLESQSPELFPEFANIAISARTYLTRPPFSALDKLEIAAELESGTAVHVDPPVRSTPEPEPATEPIEAEPARPVPVKTTPSAAARPRPSSPQPSAAAGAPAASSPAPAATSRPAPTRPASVTRPAASRPVATRANPESIDAIKSEPEVVSGSVVDDDDDLPFDYLLVV